MTGRSSREKNIGLRVGDTVIHCNDEFVIIDIRREENSEGIRLSVYAADPDQASKRQEEQIKQDQIIDKGTELIRKITEKGLGGLGDIGRG
jgi:hypothetical protein